MKNLLLEPVEYKFDETLSGVWRRFVYPNGELFEEYVSNTRLMGLPLVHFTRGKCPETGRRVVATGVIAVGRLAVGVVAFGQASAGVIAFGQLAVGLLFGFGQASTGVVAIGQLAPRPALRSRPVHDRLRGGRAARFRSLRARPGRRGAGRLGHPRGVAGREGLLSTVPFLVSPT